MKTIDFKHDVFAEDTLENRFYLHQRLLAPFLKSTYSYKPISFVNGKVKPYTYVELREYFNRLDKVIGHSYWSSQCKIDHGPHVCTVSAGLKIKKSWFEVFHEDCADALHVKINKKTDQQSISENVSSTAFAQAFKRASMHIGIGRYFYHCKMPLCPFTSGKVDSSNISNDIYEEGLKEAGFKFICEYTGEYVTQFEAAATVAGVGKVLSTLAGKELKELISKNEIFI